MTDISRRDALRFAGLGTLGLAGCLGGGSNDGGMGGDGGSAGDGDTDGGGGQNGGGETGGSTNWQQTELTNVLTGETFRIADFEKPVLVETFAVWCSNCKRQQDELKTFHDEVGDDVVSVALDIDPNESAEKVKAHAESHGYDWYYAVSPSDVTKQLTDEFGSTMASAPSVPMLLHCPGGETTRLKDGHKSTDYLVEQTDEC
ncbi:TlpA family protein disulfide reductase [Haloarchaeobius sp. TZWWS8]|uniref:TlpA family protein disulfide reductase n=1 Tax=Haloarchaeobius sp. TZWWS8 TaxID=3446121 RepID=UPI003EB8A533